MRNRHASRRWRQLVATITILGLTGLAAAGPALAHDKLIGANPADGASLPAAPSLVTVLFDEPPGNGFSGLTVIAPDGAHIDSGNSWIAGSQIQVRVKPIHALGLFTVQFHIISDDGHPVAGTLHFTVVSGESNLGVASAPSVEARHAMPSQAGGIDLQWIVIVATCIAALILINLAVRASTGPADRQT